jgi:hypothetical protein
MLNDVYFKVHDLWLVVIFILLFWPGYKETAPPERPKKGYWTVRDVFWPIRKTFFELGPQIPVLSLAMRTNLALAAMGAGLCMIASDFWAPFNAFLSQRGLIEETVLIAFLIGRGSGFWSADRKLRNKNAKQLEGTKGQGPGR